MRKREGLSLHLSARLGSAEDMRRWVRIPRRGETYSPWFSIGPAQPGPFFYDYRHMAGTDWRK